MGVTALGPAVRGGTPHQLQFCCRCWWLRPSAGRCSLPASPGACGAFSPLLYPWQFRRDTGYQLYESLHQRGSGGLWGQGLGQGHQKLFLLPEAHTDFILAIIGEELGLCGVLAVLLAFTLLVWRGLRAARGHATPWGAILAFSRDPAFRTAGPGQHVRGVGPAAHQGLPLPFVSYASWIFPLTSYVPGPRVAKALVSRARVLASIRTLEPAERWARRRRVFAVAGRGIAVARCVGVGDRRIGSSGFQALEYLRALALRPDVE